MFLDLIYLMPLTSGVNLISTITIFSFTYMWRVAKIYLVIPDLAQNTQGQV